MAETPKPDVIASVMRATKPDFTDIDPADIARFLAQQPDIAGPVEIANVRGGGANAGASSGVVVFDAILEGKVEPLVLRYAPLRNEGRIFFDYGIRQQYELQARLADAGLAVPRARWIDPDGAVLGLPGFIMEKVEGDVAHASPFSAGLIGDAAPDVRERRIASIFRALGSVHGADWQSSAVASCVRQAAGRTHFERYINWYWETVKWVQPPHRERLERLRSWLFANQPDIHHDDLALIHGDPSLGNYMLEGDEVRAIIDWELAGIVAPAYDIAMQCMANSYYRAVSAPEVAARIPDDARWVAHYESVTGRRVEHFEFFRRAVTLPLLVVQLSMSRNFPDGLRDEFLAGMEAIWAVGEGR